MALSLGFWWCGTHSGNWNSHRNTIRTCHHDGRSHFTSLACTSWSTAPGRNVLLFALLVIFQYFLCFSQPCQESPLTRYSRPIPLFRTLENPPFVRMNNTHLGRRRRSRDETCHNSVGLGVGVEKGGNVIFVMNDKSCPESEFEWDKIWMVDCNSMEWYREGCSVMVGGQLNHYPHYMLTEMRVFRIPK